MTRIYLVRHAEAEGNLYRVVQGQVNSNLTEQGWLQIAALRRRFADIHVDAVYTSDLYRTCATASAVYEPKGLTPHRCRQLREICVGDWEGRSWGEINRRWPGEMANFSHRPHLWSIDGAEKPLDVLERLKAAITAIAEENEGKTVAVFSHGYAIRLLVAHLQGFPDDRLGESPTGQNTAVSVLEYEQGRFTVLERDDTSHLQTEEYLATAKVRRKSDPLQPGLWFSAPVGTQAQDLAAALGVTLPEGAEVVLGNRGEEAVGLLALGKDSGEIALLAVDPTCRDRGFGGQMIGQAVMRARRGGAEKLTVDAKKTAGAENFLRDYGFVPAGEYWEKDIRFQAEYL